MTAPDQSPLNGYGQTYAAFDSSLMQRVRREAYGEDIGQHSWVTADELRSDLDRLGLTPESRLLDVGCGPCGPLVFAVTSTGCRGTGIDVNESALASGRVRARAAGVHERIALLSQNLDRPLPFENRSFDAVMSLDVILHVRDRQALLDEIARVLAPTGKLLFTDAGVVSGPISNEEIGRRSANGYTQLVPPGLNERLLEAAGFTLLGREDRTGSVLLHASGRLRARSALRAELQELEGEAAFEQQQRYLETVVELSERRALSRVMYLAELSPGRGRSSA